MAHPNKLFYAGRGIGRAIYPVRAVGYFLGAAWLVSYCYQLDKLDPWVWAVVFVFLTYPHVAAARYARSGSDAWREFTHLVIDKFLIGVAAVLIDFAPFPVAASFTVNAATNMSVGGPRLFLRGVAAFAAGVAAVGLAHGFDFNPDPPFDVTLLALAYLLAGTLAGNYIDYRRSLRFRQTKRQIQEQKSRIEAQAEELLRLDRAKSRFFANLSHEFRTPLTLILGSVGNVLGSRHGEVSPESRRPLEAAQKAARRLHALVEELLDLARLEAEKLPLQPAVLDFGRFVRRQSELFRAHAEKRRIEFLVTAPDGRHYAEFDPNQMAKVLTNLLANAVRFCPAAGTVGVRVDSDDGSVRLEVENSGSEIPPEALPRIFDRFYQVEDSSVPRDGLGIGLALSKELVELHGGTIGVDSGPERGAVFTVLLPAAEGSAATAPDPELAPSPFVLDEGPVASRPEEALPTRSWASAADRTTVLVVDDHAEVRELVRVHLEPVFAILEAGDGNEALEEARRSLPDLVIADVMMPELDGYELCRRLRTDPELDCIPVILLTARATPAEAVEGLSHGADDYVAKPFDGAELLARARGLIASRRRLQARWDSGALRPTRVEATSAEAAFLDKLREILDRKAHDPEFGVQELANEAAMERSALYRRVQSLLDESPSQLLRRFRLEQAAQLLAQNAGNVTEIAYGVGFASLSHFSKCFRDHYGETPSKYARGHSLNRPIPDPVRE